VREIHIFKAMFGYMVLMKPYRT